MESRKTDVADLLTRVGNGETARADELVPHVYEALRALAHRRLAKEPAGLTLQPTALVNEAYLRLVGNADPGWNGRRHFFGAAARAMRQILIERARRVRTEKHGGGRDRVPLTESPAASELPSVDLLDLDDALDALQAEDARAADVVMLRYFAGLEVAQTAEILEISERTARREWNFARVWLLDRLRDDAETRDAPA